MSQKPCPQEHLHTEAPDSYLAWQEWAAKMAETHEQEKCPGCGLFKIWRPKTEK